MAGQNIGYFVPTTQSYNFSDIKEMGVGSDRFIEFLVKLCQQTNLISEQLNSKASGLYNTQEFVTGETFFPNPSLTSGSSTFLSSRPVFRKVLNMLPTGTLPNAGTLSVAHGLTFTSGTTGVKLYGAATNTAGTSIIPLPYASPTAGNNIELNADATNVNIITGSDRTAYTKCVVIIEFLKN